MLTQKANSDLRNQVEEGRKYKLIQENMLQNEKDRIRAHYMKDDTKNILGEFLLKVIFL